MSALTKLARDRPCFVRLPGCSGGGRDTVAAHYRMLGLGCGTGIKPHDLFIAFACGPCHDLCDGRRHSKSVTREQIRLAHAEGVFRTQHLLVKEGAIELTTENS